jgi:hypothetical protein
MVSDKDIDEEDLNEGIPGTYEVEVSSSVDLSVAVSIALDVFRTKVAISCLDDFEIQTFINGIPMSQSDDEPYPHMVEVEFIGKISDEIP